jgi:hypothetical protein
MVLIYHNGACRWTPILVRGLVLAVVRGEVLEKLHRKKRS